MDAERALIAELDDLSDRETGHRSKVGVWPFRRDADMTADEMRAAEHRALLSHCRQLEEQLREMVGDEGWRSRASGGVGGGEGVYRQGVSEVLLRLKGGYTWLQAVALAADYAQRQGWLSAEQRASLDLSRPVVPEVERARAQERKRRAACDAEFKRILDNRPESVRYAEGLAAWNTMQASKYDEGALQRFAAAVRRLGDVRDNPERAQSHSVDADQSWRADFGRGRR